MLQILLPVPPRLGFRVEGKGGRISITTTSLQRKFWLPAKSAYQKRNCPAGMGVWSQDTGGCRGLRKQKLFAKIAGWRQGLFQLDETRGSYWKSLTRRRKEKGKGMKCLVNIVPWGLSKMEWTEVWGTAISQRGFLIVVYLFWKEEDITLESRRRCGYLCARDISFRKAKRSAQKPVILRVCFNYCTISCVSTSLWVWGQLGGRAPDPQTGNRNNALKKCQRDKEKQQRCSVPSAG